MMSYSLPRVKHSPFKLAARESSLLYLHNVIVSYILKTRTCSISKDEMHGISKYAQGLF